MLQCLAATLPRWNTGFSPTLFIVFACYHILDCFEWLAIFACQLRSRYLCSVFLHYLINDRLGCVWRSFFYRHTKNPPAVVILQQEVSFCHCPFLLDLCSRWRPFIQCAIMENNMIGVFCGISLQNPLCSTCRCIINKQKYIVLNSLRNHRFNTFYNYIFPVINGSYNWNKRFYWFILFQYIAAFSRIC